ncbi:MAG: hypothetical protein FWF76_06475 [Oscillospiraceae bacterium]|nr:hypothetical protein [Oscillospiraceae bacterium]
MEWGISPKSKQEYPPQNGLCPFGVGYLAEIKTRVSPQNGLCPFGVGYLAESKTRVSFIIYP